MSEAFHVKDARQREKMGIPKDDDSPGDFVVELNLFYRDGLRGAQRRLEGLYRIVLEEREEREVTGESSPVLVADTYYRCHLSVREAEELIRRDREAKSRSGQAIYRIWPDFKIQPLGF
ncbi:MAG: hypothetical protein AAGG50_12040 [Bacteroidota bacterium]